jgi:hypothetical protein
VNLTVKHTRLELDRTFSEAHRFNGELPNDGVFEQMESVQHDLETLYPEIADVAGMAITEKYREPLIKDIKERKANEQAAVVARGNWVRVCFGSDRSAILIAFFFADGGSYRQIDGTNVITRVGYFSQLLGCISAHLLRRRNDQTRQRKHDFGVSVRISRPL